MRFRERFARFMVGRYGADQFGRALVWVYLALAIGGIFFKPLYFVGLGLIGWMMYRVFSKNVYKRQRENLWYLRWSGRIKNWFKLQKNKLRDRKTHRYRQCPHCKATLRLPNKKGKHTVCCPKCRKDFEVKI